MYSLCAWKIVGRIFLEARLELKVLINFSEDVLWGVWVRFSVLSFYAVIDGPKKFNVLLIVFLGHGVCY